MTLVKGQLTPERAAAMSSRGRGIDPKGGQPYSAAALSLVYHPAHPCVPTLRADVRLFQVLSAAASARPDLHCSMWLVHALACVELQACTVADALTLTLQQQVGHLYH